MEFDGIQVLGVPGWVELGLRDGDPLRLLAKFEERDGRAVITRLILAGDVLDSSTLRAIPIGRIESLLNSQAGFPNGIAQPLNPDVLTDMADRGHLFPDEIGAVEQGLSSYLTKVPEYRSSVTVRHKRSRRKPLTRPDGSDPESFSRRVAEAYNDVIRTTRAPAPFLAEEAGVPVVTVHRWIADARRRGFLPKARKGRAG